MRLSLYSAFSVMAIAAINQANAIQIELSDAISMEPLSDDTAFLA